jgi:hypothetical protein
MHSGASGAQNVEALFFMLGWARSSIQKKHVKTHYAELVFLHLVGYAAPVVTSGASLRETSMHYFLCSGGPGLDTSKSRSRHIMPTCVSTSGWIGGSHSAFRCIWARNIDALCFMLGWDRYGFDRMHTRTRYTELLFSHPVGSAVHVVHFGASEP